MDWSCTYCSYNSPPTIPFLCHGDGIGVNSYTSVKDWSSLIHVCWWRVLGVLFPLGKTNCQSLNVTDKTVCMLRTCNCSCYIWRPGSFDVSYTEARVYRITRGKLLNFPPKEFKATSPINKAKPPLISFFISFFSLSLLHFVLPSHNPSLEIILLDVKASL